MQHRLAARISRICDRHLSKALIEPIKERTTHTRGGPKILPYKVMVANLKVTMLR